MKSRILIATLLTVLFSACQRIVPCTEGIHMLPEYGHKEKCREQLKADKEFLAECKKMFPDTTAASKYYADKGWGYISEKDNARAMQRFNQAWLLNKNNEECYWGFGVLAVLADDLVNAIPYYEKALHISDERPELCVDAANALFSYSFEKQDVNYISRSVALYKRSLALGYDYPHIYTQLSRAYIYLSLKDSADRYYAIASRVSPETIPDDLRRAIDELR